MCDALRDLVPFVQFKKREKHLWRDVTLSKSNTPPWVFFTFFKFYKWYQIAQRITYIVFSALSFFALELSRRKLQKVYLGFGVPFCKKIEPVSQMKSC